MIVAGNRDEFHARPSAPAAWWDDAANVFGGRDLVAGGSWLAMSRDGRLATVTNHPGRRPADEPGGLSRGRLVRDFVTGDRPSGRYLDAVSVAETRYAGFCLVVGTRAQLRAFVSGDEDGPRRWTLKPGISVFSNSSPSHPWPKGGYLDAALQQLVQAGDPSLGGLFALLSRREPVGGDADGTLISRTPFVVGDDYGTRASTVVRIDETGWCEFSERRFGPGGRPSGETQEAFRLS